MVSVHNGVLKGR